MAIASPSRCVIAAAVIALGSSDSAADAVGQTTEIRPLLQFAQRQEPAKPTSANIRQMQERLVWIGYYDGPLDGDAGAGTTAAVKRFQRDLGAAETGTLSASQSVTLAERANGQVQSAGFAIETDPVTGIRVGIPSAIASQKKRAAAGTTFQSPDGRVQIGLRTFRTSQEFGSVYEQLKEAFRTASVPYSVLRSDWMVLSGETDSKRFYVRYHGRNDLVSGFFAIYDKELPTERIAPLSAAITMMSLTMQPFAPGFDAGAAPRLATAAITEPASLVRQPAAAIAQTPEPRTQPPEPRTPSPEPVAPSVAPRAPAPAPTAQAAPPAPRTDDAALRAAQRKIAELEAERSKAAESLRKRAQQPAPPGRLAARRGRDPRTACGLPGNAAASPAVGHPANRMGRRACRRHGASDNDRRRPAAGRAPRGNRRNPDRTEPAVGRSLPRSAATIHVSR